jgi:hypothetical protein
MIRILMQIVVVLFLGMFAASCGMQGTFGFKKFGQDTFHRIDGVPEFASDEAVDWVFVFKKKYGEHAIGIVYQKKELVWIEMLSRTARIDGNSKVVYGSIKDLPPGAYQVVITDLESNNKLIDSKDFIIYGKEDEEEE